MTKNIIPVLFIILFLCSRLTAQDHGANRSSFEDLPQLSKIDELRKELNDIFGDPNFSNAFWGVQIQSLKTGETFFNMNKDKLFVPASLMKLFTTSSGLLLLGSDFRYTTTIYTDGRIKNGILKGNLIIKGSGDPTISNRFTSGDVNVIFEQWADSLKKIGIRKIDGNIIGDDDNFDEVKYGRGWSIQIVNNWFAPPIGALSFNDNSLRIKVLPGKPGLPAEVSIQPQLDYKVISKVFTTSSKNPPPIDVARKNGTHVISVSGVINQHSAPKILYVSVSDPTEFFLNSLTTTFKENGIEITGSHLDKDVEKNLFAENDLSPLFTHNSVPLSLIINEINKNSNNFYAEQLFKTIGFEFYGYGETQNTLLAGKEVFKKMGINPDNMIIADGSGLSRHNLVTPKQIVNILSYMYKSDEFNSFYESLPIAGTDGTLADRFNKTDAENNLRAKTGFLENIRSLAGYLKTADDEPIVFCIIVNNFLVPSQLANYIQERVCTRLVNFSRK